MAETVILGTGHYAPENIVTNDDLAEMVDTSDEWISSRTGIKERRISKGENTSHLAVEAAKKALENSGVSADDIDMIIVATVTADNFFPSCACQVQSELGAFKATAFDINAACTGFIYALDIATQFIKNGACEKALIIGAEVISKIIDWQNRNTCVLFGDGAGAAVLGRSDREGIIATYTAAKGDEGNVLTCPSIPVVNPYVENKDDFANSYIDMEGMEVFRFATLVMANSVKKVLKEGNISKDDIKYIVPHQANIRIIEYASKKLGISMDKFYVNLERYGNTSAASVPIALDEMNREGLLERGDYIVLVGFGAGLTNGAVLIRW